MGLTVPTQQKPQGYFTSVGTSLGFGERHDPLDGADVRFAVRGPAHPEEPKRTEPKPGVGEYDIDRAAEENYAPAWR